MKPILLILAAGMGSRYGGLKQIDPVGPNGETIIDYSVNDAIKAGFGKIAFIIRRDFEEAFKKNFGSKFAKHIDTVFVCQQLDSYVNDFNIPVGREKPWGTGHAVLVAKDTIDEPFAIINADDFYGLQSFKLVAEYLSRADPLSYEFCMAGFTLSNTLSEHGSVSRGICEVDEQMFLRKVTEYTKVKKHHSQITSLNAAGKEQNLTGNEVVSMNLWGFKPLIFDLLQNQFDDFLKECGNELKSEFFIPAVVDRLIQNNKARVKVLATNESWFGVTYRQDKIKARQCIKTLIKQGVYPERLWSK